jgi:hypothetical protein
MNKYFLVPSEITGYSSFICYRCVIGKKTALTWGQFEVQDAFLSRIRSSFTKHQ